MPKYIWSWEEGGFQTPLGTIDVDQEFAQQLMASNKDIVFEPTVFEREHSLEVELPFLQKTFKEFKIVPVILGQSPIGLLNEFAKNLVHIIGNRWF